LAEGLRVDIVGSNCVGKSTLVARATRLSGVRHLDLAQYLRRYPGGWRTGVRRWATILRSPRARRVVGGLVRRGDAALARRYATYYAWHAMMVGDAGSDIVLVDEGVIKKLFEAVPFVAPDAYESARRRWVEVMASMGGVILESVQAVADVMVYVSVSPEEYLRRVRIRQFLVDEVDERRILARYRLQSELYGMLVREAQNRGIGVHSIRSDEAGDGFEGFVDFLKSWRGRVPGRIEARITGE
jgi:hypothetical protein